MQYFFKRQVQLVEFGEMLYHNGLRHKGINGSLCEDILIKFLREDVPNLSFFKGQIRTVEEISPQYDVIICKAGTPQKDFLKEVNSYTNIVEANDCLGIIELKKWAHPKMVSPNGQISTACMNFKSNHPSLKYFFVCFRFKNRKNKNNWEICKSGLNVDEKFCFWGNVDNENQEWCFPWKDNDKLIKRNDNYNGEYQQLIEAITRIQTI